MTPQQKKLLEGVRGLALKEGLELKVIEIKINYNAHKGVSRYLKLIDKAHKKASRSKLKFDYHPESVKYNSTYSSEVNLYPS